MHYASITLSKLPEPPQLPQASRIFVPEIKIDDPAIAAMTDFSKDCPITALEQHTIDEALQTMKHSGVHSLLVVSKERVTGLITSFDIQGERPIQFLQSEHCPPDRRVHSAILVGDIMTAWNALPILSLKNLVKARAGDLMVTFAEVKQSHLLVTDTSDKEDSACVVRGLISRMRLQQQLGMTAGFQAYIT